MLCEPSGVGGRPSRSLVIESVADATRRDALVVLQGRTDPVSIEELATGIAALQRGTPFGDVTHAERKPVAVALVHVHLPALEAVDLLAWTPGEAVEPTIDTAAIDDQKLREIVSIDADDWDAVLRALADARRRLALAILNEADGGVDRDALARRIVARETGAAPSEVAEHALEDSKAELRHVHLPTLQEAGLVSTDGETVTYEGHRDLGADLLPSAPPRVDGVGC